MKALHCYRTYFPDPPGGLQEAIRQMCLSTRRYGVENRVFCLSPNPEPKKIEREECLVIRRRSWAAPASCDLGAVGAFKEFTRLARDSDIVHYQFPWPFADVLHCTAGHGKPSVLTYHSDIVRQKWLDKMYRPLMWKMLREMRSIVATSPTYVETSPVLSHPSIRDKVQVIPLGIDEDSYPAAGDNQIFERTGVSADDPYFLFIGVLRYYKGIHFLVEAAKGLEAKVVIAGYGPEEGNLRAQARQINAANIVFTGRVTDAEKVSLLKHCRALVLPSHLRSEAFGMVQVEAQMFSRPLISCEIGSGTSYVNAHEESGYVIPPASPEILRTTMKQLFNDDRLANVLGQGARSRYEKLFSGPSLGQAYFKLYKEVIG